MTLHDVTRRFGLAHVAARLGVTAVALAGWRSGRASMPLDILAKLKSEWPDLDLTATVARLGGAVAGHRKVRRRGMKP
jgi:hypothetical protein